MFKQTDISVIFNQNGIPGNRALGYGSVNILGIVLSYTVYPSPYGLGFMVSFASKPVIKDGVQEKDANGRPKYFKEVYIQNIDLRNMIDEAVQNAMANKGVVVGQAATLAGQPQSAPPQQPSTNFSQPAVTASNPAPPQVTQPTATPQPTIETYNTSLGSSIIADDELPF
jgi:hypothetical protein